ncbi:MAG: c-type cytochrome [Rubrivivax sp.]|nr:c-type cytochrome [Pyrinomonadaceae bacterium]
MTKVRLMRGAACVCLALVASVMIAGRATPMTTATSQSPPQGDKPVEQTRKNIQVLKGLPESQLFSVMNFVSVSLGVSCNFCHVKQGKDPKTGFDNWIWESDEKQEKKTARDMMRMVLAINKDAGAYSIARGQVTCYTCHRGQEHPASLPSLPLAKSGHEPAETDATPTPSPRPTPPPTPTVQQVFDKYVAAVGGSDAIARFQTTVVKGTRDASQGRSFPFEATSKGADKFLIVVQVPEAGTFTQGLNGASGWVKNPRTQRALNPAELMDLRRTAELLDVIKFKPTATMRVAGQRRMGEREVLVVVDRPKEGVTQRFFFDSQTGLLLRITTVTDTVLNPIPEQLDFEDYRDVEGVKLPFVIRLSNIDTYYSVTRNIREVRHNVPVEDKQFDMPPAPPATLPKP